LSKVGITPQRHFIYDYGPVKIDWWDSENKTSIEVECQQHEDGWNVISVIFCPNVEGIVERTVVFYTSYQGNNIEDRTLIAKSVFENIANNLKLPFSEEHQAYFTRSISETRATLTNLLNLIQHPEPLYKFDLSAKDEDESRSEIGETIEHFLAMMSINSTEFTKENIIDSLEIGLQTEGIEYLKNLQKDIETQPGLDFYETYGVEQDTVNLIKEAIYNYLDNKRFS